MDIIEAEIKANPSYEILKSYLSRFSQVGFFIDHLIRASKCNGSAVDQIQEIGFLSEKNASRIKKSFAMIKLCNKYPSVINNRNKKAHTRFIHRTLNYSLDKYLKYIEKQP